MNTPFPFPNVFLSFPNRTLLYILAVSILLLPLDFLVAGSIKGLGFIAEMGFMYAGLSILLKSGKFAYTHFARFVNLSIAVSLFGAMFKIMHWPAADILLMIGLYSIPIIYIVYFFTVKKDYTIVSVLKVLFVFSAVLWRSFAVFHWPYAQELQIVQLVAYIGILLIVITQNFSLLKNT